MISKPASLAEWTLELVREIAASGLPENDWHDLKSDLPSKEHCRKIAAAFANSEGGFLVYGVTDDRQVVGVANPELPRDFANKLTHDLNPSLEYEFGSRLPVEAGHRHAVWICHVPKSRRGPHAVLAGHDWTFPKRTAAGTVVSMSPEEVRAAFSIRGERQTNLRRLRAEVKRLRSAGERINVENNAQSYRPELYLTRLAPEHARALMQVVFEDIEGQPLLFQNLEHLLQWCSETDQALALAASKGRPMPGKLAEEVLSHEVRPQTLLKRTAPQVVIHADQVLADLEKLIR